MKKKFFYLILLVPILLSSCKYDLVGPCNNGTYNLRVGMDWSGTNYNACGGSFDGNTQPPDVHYNYLHENSFNMAPAKLMVSTDYLCTVVSTNDEPAKDGCSGAASSTTYWSAGSLQTITSYAYYQSDIMVDYYDVCSSCSSAGKNARPHFVGMTVMPGGGLPTIVIKQYLTAPYYTNSSCN